MATHLIAYGHGAGDPGAVGQGTCERDFNRFVLHPYIKKWADKSKHNFEFYDITGNKDLFRDTANGWGMYSIRSNQYASITEIHEDAASSSATGGHNIVSSSLKADNNDFNLASVIKKYVGWWGSVQNTRGISYRNNLLNLNVAAQRGINYRLMELGFITNATDMNNIKRNLDGYAKGIIEGITGEKLEEVKTVVKYQETPGLYEALKTDNVYHDKYLKEKSSLVIVKGQRWYLEDIVKAGRYTRAKIRINNDVRYITMRDDYWKLISKTKAKKIK